MALFLGNTEEMALVVAESSAASDTLAYVYKWTHIPTGKWYVGSRTAKGSHPSDGYICSSKIVKPMIIENASEWSRDIIAVGTPIEMREFENTYLKDANAASDPMSFNQTNGDGKFYMTEKSHTSETKELIASKLTGLRQSSETRRKKSMIFSGEGNPFYGKHHTDETKNYFRMLYTGTTVPDETKMKISETLTGTTRPEEVKSKIAKSVASLSKLTCVHCGITCSPATHGRWHGDNCKYRSSI